MGEFAESSRLQQMKVVSDILVLVYVLEIFFIECKDMQDSPLLGIFRLTVAKLYLLSEIKIGWCLK